MPHFGYRRLFEFAAQRAAQQKLLQLAASLTFTTVLSIVPLLAVALALFTAFPLFKEFSQALQDFLTNSLLPPNVSENIMFYLNDFAASAARLTTIGGSFLVLTVMFLIMSVESALNQIWNVERPRGLAHRLLVYWAIISLGPVLAGASLYTTAFLARESTGLLISMPVVLESILKVFPFILSGFALAALYLVVPNKTVARADALIGGFVSALILESMKIVFAYYVSQFSTYTMIYGAFAALPVFLIWVYLSWLGVLVGAIVSASLPFLRAGHLELEPLPGAGLIDALSLLQQLSLSRGDIPPGLSATELARRLRLPEEVIQQRLEALTTLGMVSVTLESRGERWVMTCDPTRTSIGPLVDLFAINRAAIQLGRQAYLGRALSDLFTQTDEPTLAAVLTNHDSILAHPLQSHSVASVAGDIHAKSQ